MAASTRAVAAAARAGIPYAGRRGLELELSPHDLLALTGGRARAIAAPR